MKRILILLCFLGMLTAALHAQTQTQKTRKHPNLTQAQTMIEEAQAKLTAAQKVNEFDLGGHAQKAKTFLEQAGEQLKLAATAADKSDKKTKGDDKKQAESPTTLEASPELSMRPNLSKAQQLIIDAYARIDAAQKANEFDLGGHAQKAKKLLEQANEELKLAAVKSNE